MNDSKILESLNLPADPINALIRVKILTDEGNIRRFRIKIFEIRIEPDYIELTTSVRRIKGISFNRLLCRIENGEPYGNWIALAKIPAKSEEDWVRRWQVLEFKPVAG